MTVQQCAHCGSFDIQAGLDHFQCLICGLHTSADGRQSVPPSSYDPPKEN